MKLLKTLLNQKAFNLIELMMSSLLIILIFSAFMTFVLNMQKQIISQDKNLALKTKLQDLFQDISSNPSEYQRYYSCIKEENSSNGCVTEDSLLEYDDLPFALNSQNTLEPVASCAHCKNRVGYLLYASGTNSFLKLVLRASNPEGIIFNLKSFVGE